MMNRFVKLAVIACISVSMIGCDAFVRKFTRKRKKGSTPQEEMVIAPQEYKGPELAKDELYRQYLLYSKSWLSELAEALTASGNHKKRIVCAEEALKNLELMKPLLKENQQIAFGAYVKQLVELRDAIIRDEYGQRAGSYRVSVERFRRAFLRDFSYEKIKEAFL